MTIPIDERLISDEQVFSAFDLNSPGLEETAAAYRSGELETAKQHLCDYFLRRSNVCFLFDYRHLPFQPIRPEENPYAFQASLGFGEDLNAFCLEAGKKMMQNIYVLPGKGRGEIPLGENFEHMIHYNFLTGVGTGPRFHLDLFVRGQFFEYLAILYHETGDKKVCEHFTKVLNKFLETYPLQVVDTSPSANRFQYEEDRDAMSVGFLALAYITLLYTRLPYDAGYPVVFTLLKHIWFLGLQFRRFDTDTYKPYNHHMWERGLIPFMLGTLLPEIPAFADMQRHGADIVSRHVKEDFNKEGGYNEHSIAYWSGAALGEMLYRGASLARLNNIELLDSDALGRIDKSFTALAAICPPGKAYPAIGDNRGPLVNPVLALGVAMTGNTACAEVLAARTNGKPSEGGMPFDFSSQDVGFVCLRSSFAPDANYVLLSAKTDCGASGHNHMDMLSLCLTMRGVPVIGEPYADSLYHKVKVGCRERGYMYNMRAHNTVLAFGESVAPDRVFADKWGVYRPDSPVTDFVSSETGAYVSAYHVGYPHCRHTRRLLFARNGALLIRDEIARGNRVSEPHLQRWHLMQGCKVRVQDSASAIVEQDGVTLLFVWDTLDSLKLQDDSDILRPNIVKPDEPLAPILEAAFSNMHDITTDLLMVPLNLLILDITGGKIFELEPLRQTLRELALQMDAPDALERLANL